MTRQAAGMRDADGDGLLAYSRYARLTLIGLIAIILVSPASHLLRGPLGASDWLQLAGSLAAFVLAVWTLDLTARRVAPVPWLGLAGLLVIALALFALGGVQWAGLLAVAAGLSGRFSSRPLPAVLTVTACGLTVLVVAAVRHNTLASIMPVLILPPVAGLLGYVASKRMETLDMLRRTRAELVRAAAAEERLRIARDLHDLLGHSLSLITLKAELAGRVVAADPGRAAREIADVESVARQSLSDVRAAVAGFRQPDLAAELVAARRLLDAAGISSSITSPGPAGLSQEVDATLAWAVREGTTNAVRHSQAARVVICVSAGTTSAVAEIRDDGPLAPAALVPAAAGDRVPHARQAPKATSPDGGQRAAGRARPAFAGAGLAGLAERVRQLGGELAAGAVRPHGFVLRVVIPLPPKAC